MKLKSKELQNKSWAVTTQACQEKTKGIIDSWDHSRGPQNKKIPRMNEKERLFKLSMEILAQICWDFVGPPFGTLKFKGLKGWLWLATRVKI